MVQGTTVEATVSRVVDGDTIRVFLPRQSDDESLRILALDTEESRASGSKPVTPWGKKAKARAEEFFSAGDKVTLEFPGKEDLETCLQRYRGNFGRLLVFVYKNDVDFQETMIREGYSPYFVKYGNAAFQEHHQRYQAAERIAQQQNIGVWNQLAVNGSEVRNYAALGTWWQLRALIIDQYRLVAGTKPNLFNSRLDYAAIEAKARVEESATIFTELRSVQPISGDRALIRIGSQQQPFNVFIPDTSNEEGETLLNLLKTRYISGDANHPRRGYAYVTGKLSLFREQPQITVTAPEQITDELPE